MGHVVVVPTAPGSIDGPATTRRAVRSNSQRRHAITAWERENQRQAAHTPDDIAGPSTTPATSPGSSPSPA
jgi:hypothetical protein